MIMPVVPVYTDLLRWVRWRIFWVRRTKGVWILSPL